MLKSNEFQGLLECMEQQMKTLLSISSVVNFMVMLYMLYLKIVWLTVNVGLRKRLIICIFIFFCHGISCFMMMMISDDDDDDDIMGFYLHLMMGMNFCKIFGFFYEIGLFSCNEKNCPSSLKVKLLVYRDLTISWFVIFFIFRMRFDISYFYIFFRLFL